MDFSETSIVWNRYLEPGSNETAGSWKQCLVPAARCSPLRSSLASVLSAVRRSLMIKLIDTTVLAVCGCLLHIRSEVVQDERIDIRRGLDRFFGIARTVT